MINTAKLLATAALSSACAVAALHAPHDATEVHTALVEFIAAGANPVVLQNSMMDIECVPGGGCGADVWVDEHPAEWLEGLRRSGVIADYCTDRSCGRTATGRGVPNGVQVALSTLREVRRGEVEVIGYLVGPPEGHHAESSYLRYRLERRGNGWFVSDAETLVRGRVSF